MAALKLKHSDISDINLYKLATLGCFAAVDWLIYRSTKYSGEKKVTISALIKKIKTFYRNNGIDYNFGLYSFDKLSDNLLCKWHVFLFELPLNALVHPLNGTALNTKILKSPNRDKVIKAIITPINFKKVKLSDHFISSAELNKLCTSLIQLNWEYKKSARERPNKDYLNYFVDQGSLEKNNGEAFHDIYSHLDSFPLNEEQIRFILLFVSRELIFFLNSLSSSSLQSLRRLLFVSDSLIKERKDRDIIRLSPSYSILREGDLDQITLLEKLSSLGYKKIVHLDFLQNDILDCLLDKNFSRKLDQTNQVI